MITMSITMDHELDSLLCDVLECSEAFVQRAEELKIKDLRQCASGSHFGPSESG